MGKERKGMGKGIGSERGEGKRVLVKKRKYAPVQGRVVQGK